MAGPDRRTYEGRTLITRGELARVTGEREHTLYKWYAARTENGHPDGLRLDGRLYFDEQEWRTWRAEYLADRRTLDGRVVVSRGELARVTGEPTSTLERWYGGRAGNSHPEQIRVGSRAYFDEQEWLRWYAGLRAAQKAGLTPVDRPGDPDELLSTAEAARLLGYTSTSTLTGYISRGQFIEPDETEDLPSGRRRRWWTRRRLLAFADQRTWSRAAPSSSVPVNGSDSS